MQILLNGETRQLPDGASVAALLERLELTGKRFAVEVNEEVVPRSEYAQVGLHEGDRVEIVRAIGGG
ncbi:MAG: sulfur carrier protein ThiS [Gammaproteobacteria bacterium]|nr:sulfur carrier protein ThiS [Gammaproteobacteria bacterium]NIR82555.1 sulfur carrier protein ThiS [Gammaproteobacteria bacterium]NIR88602.1 sulfur carrier protein ThiS [Gammaproteobacteria bacterium]NIU03696.1 sulfur carrier protein ThiS [Gammaproteobacteria bacterium]NIV51031.1 sulfur carrier protein ThiS [Gammaproteobacteria bacterium]